MAVNIKNNFATIIENKDGGVVNVNTTDAVERYEQYISAIEKETTTEAKPRKRKTETKIIDSTFTYRWLKSRESQNRVAILYQTLLTFHWIDKDTPPDSFEALFLGKLCDTKVKWTGKKSTLAYLFKVICGRHYVVMPEGMEKKIWLIVQSHFVDSNSRVFVNLNKEKRPKNKAGTIESVADILNPAKELVEIDFDKEWDGEE